MIICVRSLVAGEALRKREPELAPVILRHRMVRSGSFFGRAFPRTDRFGGLLPLV